MFFTIDCHKRSSFELSLGSYLYIRGVTPFLFFYIPRSQIIGIILQFKDRILGGKLAKLLKSGKCFEILQKHFSLNAKKKKKILTVGKKKTLDSFSKTSSVFSQSIPIRYQIMKGNFLKILILKFTQNSILHGLDFGYMKVFSNISSYLVVALYIPESISKGTG